MTNQIALTAKTAINNDNTAIDASIHDRRPDALAVFAPLNEAQRASLTVDAWAVGLRAIANAHRHAEESKLADVGKSLLDDVDAQLKSYVERQQATMLQVLARYFDPRDGQVVTRLDSFLRDGGELTTTMARFLEPEHGEVAKTLARQLGESSPLLKRLSPTDSEGIVHILETRFREALAQNQTAMAQALDPLAKDGAIARFLTTLRKEMEKADNDRTKQLALATKALDANDESSLLSRLMRETHSARVAFVRAMNPDEAGSPLAVLKKSLTELLQAHAKSQSEALSEAQERQARLEKEIRESLTRLEERKRGDAKSIRGGFAFQDAVLRFVQNAVDGAPVVVDMTANTIGNRPNCKIGDQVLRFTSESVYAGSAVVIEAKRDAYAVSKALEELEVARSNRDAASSVFVMARSHAPAGFPTFARYGSSILVVWDEEDEMTDAYLHAAVLLGLALASLATRANAEQHRGEIEALADIEHRIQQELGRFDKMRKLSDSIRKDAEAIGEEVRKGAKGLGVLLTKAKSTLKALNVELAATVENDVVPVALPPESLVRARGALKSGGDIVGDDSAAAE